MREGNGQDFPKFAEAVAWDAFTLCVQFRVSMICYTTMVVIRRCLAPSPPPFTPTLMVGPGRVLLARLHCLHFTGERDLTKLGLKEIPRSVTALLLSQAPLQACGLRHPSGQVGSGGSPSLVQY